MDINVTIDDRVTSQCDDALALLGDLTPVFDEFGAWQDGATDDLFTSQQDPYETSWWRLKESTIAQKQRRGEFLTILQATGKMRASVVSKSMKAGYRHGFSDRKAVYHDRAESVDRKRQLLPDADQGLPPRSARKLQQILERRMRGR